MVAYLDLQQRAAPPALVLTPRFSQHQTLSTVRFDFFEHVEYVILGLGTSLIHNDEFFRVVFSTYIDKERSDIFMRGG